MQKTLLFFLFALASLLGVRAESWTAENVPIPYLKDATKYVSDPENILQASSRARTDSILFHLEKDKGVQTVVVVVKRLKGDDPYEFGMELARKYKIGAAKQNTGLIIVLATEDRSYQILTGTGLEGTLPDAICRRVQNRVMVPHLKMQEWDAAIEETVKALDGIIRQDETVRKAMGDDEDEDVVLGVIALIAFGIFMLVILLAAAKSSRCPSCKQAMLKVVKKERLRTSNHRNVIRVVKRCPRCGHEKVELTEDNSDSGLGEAAAWGAMTGMMSGHSRGGFGGGSFGGSFGGGMFGGGGSGGRF